ncbi:NagB 6-phosphogluconolactonase/Glucosamine-6-phosphate isomerase/deaminase [Burkholderiaceae bacterium]
MFKNLLHFPKSDWAPMCAMYIQKSVSYYLDNQGSCSVMLTGGMSAALVYAECTKQKLLTSTSGISFYFSDERAVPFNHPDSNYCNAISTLFIDPLSYVNNNIYPIVFDGSLLDIIAKNYEQMLPDSLDLLLLTFSSDGHIASIFPGDATLSEYFRKVLPVNNGGYSHPRLTITPRVILDAKLVCVLLNGEQKIQLFYEMIQDIRLFKSLPVGLLANATWLMSDG